MSTPFRIRGLVVIMLMVAAGFSNQTGATEPFTIEEDGWHGWRTESVDARDVQFP